MVGKVFISPIDTDVVFMQVGTKLKVISCTDSYDIMREVIFMPDDEELNKFWSKYDSNRRLRKRWMEVRYKKIVDDCDERVEEELF